VSWLTEHLLSWIVFLPLIGAGLVLFIGRQKKAALRYTALGFSLLVFAVSLPLWFGFDESTAAMQFVELADWVPGLGISYHVGLDGISLLLVLLTTFMTPLTLLSSFSAVDKHLKEFLVVMLMLETGMLGAFLSLDLFLFYIFWEAMLIPMCFIIGVWGGPRRVYAAVKFFLYTLVGSLLMLVAILTMYFLQQQVSGIPTFDMQTLMTTPVPARMQLWLFLAFALSFAIKVPMFPFHTWLPDAHVEAPTAGSVILAAILLKLGTYGFIRFAMPFFPESSGLFTTLFASLAVIGIIYGALVAMVQKDIKKLVAYSSVSHLGYVMLGLFALTIQGVEGAIFVMLAHGLSTGGLFLIVGMLYERRHTRMIADFGGLAKQVPLFTAIFMIVTLSSIGLPGLNGFVGEILVLVGTFTSDSMNHAKAFTALATTGMILGAVYMLWMFRRVMFGPLEREENKSIKDLGTRELAVLIPILIFIVWMGVYPRPFLRKMDVSVAAFVERVKVTRRANAELAAGGGQTRDERDARSEQ
jgi:NADH-quinone oxidoreductase subunit M